jgi:hypothetical protein
MATITVTASDADGDQLSFSYAASGGTVQASGPSATTASFTAGTAFGPASVTVTVTDGKGGSTQTTANLYVQNPSPPALCFDRGDPCATSYSMTVTPAEAIVVTEVAAQNRYDGNCFPIVQYGASPVVIGAHQSHQFSDLGCLEWTSSSNASISDWTIDVYGRRAEPDGGTFHVRFTYAPKGTVQPQCSP